VAKVPILKDVYTELLRCVFEVLNCLRNIIITPQECLVLSAWSHAAL